MRLTIVPYAQRREYISALAGALRGSGLRYTELADHISKVFSPQEIALLAEQRKLSTVMDALQISDERALRLCDALRKPSGAALFSLAVEDDVQIQLMDGTDYKGIDFLSMGQRCTAILSIILRHMERIIIIERQQHRPQQQQRILLDYIYNCLLQLF